MYCEIESIRVTSFTINRVKGAEKKSTTRALVQQSKPRDFPVKIIKIIVELTEILIWLESRVLVESANDEIIRKSRGMLIRTTAE